MNDLDLSVAGDDDRWMLLDRLSSEDFPLIVRTRINPVAAEFGEANRIIAVICDLDPKYVRDDGLPTCLDELHQLEDLIVEAVAASGPAAFHTASVTGDGRRVLYFAIERGLDAAAAIEEVASEVAVLSVYDDFDFETYRDFVTPTALDKQFDGDRSVISNIQKHGDDGATPRKIDFWFYGARPALETLIDRLKVNGFSLDHWVDEPEGVVLSIETSANMNSFGEITPLLVDTAAELSVEYDGWETPVVSESSPQSQPALKPSLFGRLFGQRKH